MWQKIIKIADSVIYEEGQVIPENCLEVLKLHRLAAEQGSAEAQCSLGKFYLDGRLIPADPMRAHKWLLLSAEQGYADGQYELGLLIHRSGQLTEEDKKDPTQAYQISLQWLNLAIQAGHSKAQFALGKMYEKGKGPPKDIKKAIELYKLSALQKNADAQHSLGNIYHYGAEYIKKDNFNAYIWFNLSASNCHKHGIRMRNRAENEISPEQIAKAQKTVRKNIKKPPNGFDPLDFIVRGDGIKKRDLDKGMKAFKKRDYSTAFHEWQPRAERGEAKALAWLGSMYKRGLGVSKNYSEALKLFSLAVEQGHADGQAKLAEMYCKGLGVTIDFKKAAELFSLASKQGHPKAQANLGIMYVKGEGVPQDYVIAYVFSDVSISNGYKKGAELRDDIAENMTHEQIAEAQELSASLSILKKETP